MSIHAQLTPEALEALKRQKRNSTISSIVIAALTILLVGLILGFFLLENYVRETPTIVTYAATLNEDQQLDERKVTTTIQRKPSSPSSAQAKVIAAATASPTAIPVPEIEITTPSESFGDTDDFGFGFGDESGMGGGFQGIPSAMRKRCSPQDRLARLQETGGAPESEPAVERGLEWLMKTQNANGSWTTGSHTAGYTGLGLLTYLGRCETPMSTKYGESVLKAITWLIDLGEKNNGVLATSPASKHVPYDHSIALYALAEAYTFCNQLGIVIPNHKEMLLKAGQYMIDNQNANGGWAYSYAKQGGHVDTSIVAWHMQALKAMQYTGLEFDGLVRSANRGVEYLERMQNANGGFGYRSANAPAGGAGYFTMTGGCVLSLQLWGKGNSSAVRNGAKYIEENTKFNYDDTYADLYGHYYEIQVMLNRGGEQWRKYNELVRDQLLANQETDGSWKRVNTKGGKIRAVAPQFVQNTHYRTCLVLLMLESYYRFLPATGAAR
ncbi:MAG: prenyltransferase/squalene oxidase repeat-containing protein [Luteolibacter sp.]